MSETIEQARARAIAASKLAQDLTAILDDSGKADQEDDAYAQARGQEALRAADEAGIAAGLAHEFKQVDRVVAQADRAERALARVRERMGADPGPQTNMRTMRIVLGITVVNTDARFDDTNASIDMMHRVITAILPHPDDAVHTGHGNERVTVIMTDWEVTS